MLFLNDPGLKPHVQRVATTWDRWHNSTLNTQHFLLLEPAAICLKSLTCTASQMNSGAANSSATPETCWKT